MDRALGLPFIVGLSLLITDPAANLLSEKSSEPFQNLRAALSAGALERAGSLARDTKQNAAPDIRIAGGCKRLLRVKC